VVGWWVMYGVGKKTHKNCVSGPIFACRVSPRHAFSGKNSRHHHVGPTCRRHSQLRRLEEEEWKTLYMGVEVVFHPYTLLNNQLFIESGWNIGNKQ